MIRSILSKTSVTFSPYSTYMRLHQKTDFSTLSFPGRFLKISLEPLFRVIGDLTNPLCAIIIEFRWSLSTRVNNTFSESLRILTFIMFEVSYSIVSVLCHCCLSEKPVLIYCLQFVLADLSLPTCTFLSKMNQRILSYSTTEWFLPPQYRIPTAINFSLLHSMFAS